MHKSASLSEHIHVACEAAFYCAAVRVLIASVPGNYMLFLYVFHLLIFLLTFVVTYISECAVICSQGWEYNDITFHIIKALFFYDL